AELLVLAGAVEGDDVEMLDGTDGLALLPEARPRLGLAGHLVREELEGAALALRARGLVDVGVAVGSEVADDAVAADEGARNEDARGGGLGVSPIVNAHAGHSSGGGGGEERRAA